MRNPGHFAGHPVLHAHEAVPATQRHLSQAGLSVSDVYHPVDRHGMVARADERPTVTYQAEQTAAEALVVVENVEFRSPARQDASHPQAEGQGFGEPACEHSGDFAHVRKRVELTETRYPERVGLSVKVKARDLYELDTFSIVHVRPGLAGKNRYPVAQPGQLPGQEPDVHSLPARTRVTPVGEEGNPELFALTGAGDRPDRAVKNAIG